MLGAYAPQAARTIQARKSGPEASQAEPEKKLTYLSLEQAAAEECARIDAVLAAKAGKLEPAEKTESRRYQTLREKRRAEFLDRDPLDRFLACCVRSRIPKADILEALEAAEPKILDARRRGLKLTFTDKLKRVLQAFELMSDHLRSLTYFDLASMEDWK